MKRRAVSIVAKVATGLLMVSVSLFISQAAHAAYYYQLGCYPYGNPDFAFGQYISGWGYHVGEDVCHEAGTPVYAAADGVVVYSAQTPTSYRWGNLIIIEHTNNDGNKVVSLYGHLNTDRRVGAGQYVAKGQRIATVGAQNPDVNGGWEPHLHFGMHPGGYGAGVGTYAPWVHGYEYPCCGGWVKSQDYVNARIAPYDHVPYDVVGDGTMFYNGETQVQFRVRNTGFYTWRKDGDNPIRLGTIIPQNRSSGFSDGGAAPGWAGTNRIKLDADTPSGGLATFTATFRSVHVPGTYPECFSPVIENIGWMDQRPICVNATVLPPQWRGEWYTQMITTNSDPTNLTGQTSGQYLKPGDKLNLKVMVKNVGELPWETSGDNLVRLATSRPNDRPSGFATGGDGSIPTSENWSAYNRPSEIDGRYDPGSNTVVADSSITTGEIAVFSYTITAPSQPGTYNEYFQPVAEGHYFMRDLGIYFPLRVLDSGYHYQWVTQTSTPSSVGQTDTFQDVTMQIRNTGQTAWPVNGDVHLGTDRPQDASSIFYTPSGTGAWLAPNRLGTITRNVTNGAKSTVDPGEVAEFGARLTVPTTLAAGQYQLYVRPVKEGVTWFPEDYGAYFPINITVPPYQHQVTDQEFSGNPSSFPHNSSMTAKLAVKNTGRATWQAAGANPVHLGTERPKDRASGFADFSGGDPWLASNRASAIDGRVTSLSPFTTTPDSSIEPNETAGFVIPLKANPGPGTYNEYFNLVTEGITWFPDIGIYFPLTVTP